DVFIALTDTSDTRTVTAFVAELRQQAPGISPVSHRYSKTDGGQYFAAECPWYGALFGSFFMTNAMFPDRPLLNCKLLSPVPPHRMRFAQIPFPDFQHRT